MRRVPSRCNAIDTHELLKREVLSDDNVRYDGTNNNVSTKNPATKYAPSPNTGGKSRVGFEDVELYFDSLYRDSSSDYSSGEIKWPITVLNNSNDIKNCIAMSIGRFFFPRVYGSVDKPDYFYYRRVFLEFTDAPSSQGILAPNANKFHFEFRVEGLNSQAVELIPIKKTFYFQRPIASISDFQLRFTTPLNMKKIPLPADTVSISSLLTVGPAGYNPIRFKINGDTTAVLGQVGTTGSPGIAVVISGFTSASGTLNVAVNNIEGVYITNIIDSTTFEIGAIDGSVISAIVSAKMYIPKNRIAFPMRFTCVRYMVTNHITITHE